MRALVQSGTLSPEDRDILEQRLLVTLDAQQFAAADVLETTLRATQLLDLIGRPVDRDAYRPRVHAWLRKLHVTRPRWFQIGGGFAQYESVTSASMETTAYAVQLMKIYGAPDDLDLHWVRSFLRPMWFRPSGEKWVAAATLARLNGLPDSRPPTWWEWIYYERSLLAAIVLVGLCIYATLSAPLDGRLVAHP